MGLEGEGMLVLLLSGLDNIIIDTETQMGNTTNRPKRGVVSSKGIPERSYIQILCSTAYTFTPYLFDYSDQTATQEQIAISTSGIITKGEKKPFKIYPITYLDKQLNGSLPGGIKFIAHRISHKKGFFIEPIKIVVSGRQLEKAIWKVVKFMPDKKHVCKEGDIFRLGWQKFKIKELVFKQSENPIKKGAINTKHTVYQNLSKSNSKAKKDKHGLDLSTAASCRICLDEGTTEDPLIPPCQCLGSMKFIHMSCLHDWLDKKLQHYMFRGAVLINWKPLKCELCQSSYMHQIYLDGKKHYTLNFPVPERPYVVMQILDQGESNKVYELISFAQKPKQYVGRGEEADIYLPGCSSVSYIHSCFTYDSLTNEFIIEDLDSRYGTLVLQNRPMRVDQNFPVAFQVGMQLFQIKMIKGEDEQRNQEITKENCEEQFKNLVVFDSDDDEDDSEYQRPKIEKQIQDFTKPFKLIGLNVLSIRPFQTNINESRMVESEGQDQDEEYRRELPTGRGDLTWKKEE